MIARTLARVHSMPRGGRNFFANLPTVVPRWLVLIWCWCVGGLGVGWRGLGVGVVGVGFWGGLLGVGSVVVGFGGCLGVRRAPSGWVCGAVRARRGGRCCGLRLTS